MKKLTLELPVLTLKKQISLLLNLTKNLLFLMLLQQQQSLEFQVVLLLNIQIKMFG